MNINRLQKFIKRPDNFYTLVTCCLYLGLSLAFIGRAGNIINPDGVEYSVIATHYAHGDFHAAINGIWSPLLSWLLVIPAFFNLSVLLFFRLILVGLSLATIVASSYFLRQFFDAKRTPYLHHLGLLFITLFCFYATILTPMTPDLFSVFFIIWFMAALTAYHYQPTPRRALYIGVVGGLGYYGKNYFAYFAATAIIIFLVIRAVTHQSNVHQAIKHAAMSMATLIIIVLPWICLMSYKYGHFTTNPIGAYAMGQQDPHGTTKGFITYSGLLQPLYGHSLTAREDISQYPSGQKWSPLESSEDFKYYTSKVIPHNIKEGVAIMWPILLGLYTILLLLIAQTSTRKKLFNDRLGVYALIFGLIYTGGYCLEHLEGGFRYIWPSYVLLAFTLIRWSGFLNFTHKYKVAIATILVFGLSVYPIATSYRPTVSAIQNSEEIKQLAKQIDAKIDLPDYSHVATNSPYSASYLCYYLNLKCYGLPHKENVQGQLLKNHIDYFFEFSGHRHFGVKGIKVFSSNKLTILEVRPDTSPKR